MLNNSFCLIKQCLRRLSGQILFVVSGIGLFGCITYPPPTIEASDASVSVKPVRVPIPNKVQVQPGEGLHAIATRYGLDYMQIAAWNGIPPPYNNLSVGQILCLSPRPCNGTVDKQTLASANKLDYSKSSRDTAAADATDANKEKLLGYSEQKRPIKIRSYGSGSGPLTLVIGGIHGDEDSAIKLIKQFVDELDQDDSKVVSTCRVAVIPEANPDGIARHTRTNSRGVDLNRNFKTDNWTSKQPNKKQRYKPGTSAGSELETQVLMQAIDELRPARIIVPHSPLKLINFDGPAEDLAREMSRHTGYKVVSSIGYPTPGSIGNYAGVERSIPIITLELPPNPSSQEMKKSLDALYAVVNYKKCQK